MLYEFLFPLREYESAFNIFRYISFRAAGAAVTALVLSFIVGPRILRRLRAMQIHQVVRDGTPDTHAAKGTTPTMGGLIILVAVAGATLLWMRLDSRYVWLALAVTLAMGALGFLDDYLKLRQKRLGQENLGLVERYKLTGQVLIGLALGWYIWQVPLNQLPGASTTLPFYKYLLIVPAVPLLYLPFVTFVMTGTSNAVNLTDGLDGLATGCSLTTALAYTGFGYICGNAKYSDYLGVAHHSLANELPIIAMALAGACLGFLWFNAHPARMFMGDTGSLALGGCIAAIAIGCKQEIVLALVGGVFVMEAMSVIIQVVSFKKRGKRVFRMAPIHHHFELGGWHENQVIVRFWIMSLLFALLGLATLKLR